MNLLIRDEDASIQDLTPQAVVVTPRSFIRVERRGVRRDCGFLAGVPRNDGFIGKSIVCAALLLLCLPVLASAQGSGVLSPAYEAVVGRYLSGDRKGAVADIGAWSEERLRDEMAALSALSRKAQTCRTCAPWTVWQQVPARAALGLHSDCAQGARRDGSLPACTSRSRWRSPAC